MVKIMSENGQRQKSVKQRPTQKQDEGKSLGNDFCSANTKPNPDHTETERSSNKLRGWNKISPVWVLTAKKGKPSEQERKSAHRSRNQETVFPSNWTRFTTTTEVTALPPSFDYWK
jgi:hypothetical protein